MSDEKLAWSPMPDGSLIIDMQGIYKRFYIGQPNELEILKGIDLQVGRGEFVSIVGASGSGKSTLMNIIGALDRPTEGSYTLDGVPMARRARQHAFGDPQLQDRVRLPDLQPHPAHLGVAQRRASDALFGHGALRPAAAARRNCSTSSAWRTG